VRALTRGFTAALGLALIAYPFTIASRPEVLLPSATASFLLLALCLGTARWIFAGPSVAMFIVEYGSALLVAARGIDPLSPAVGVACIVLVEMIDASLAAARPTQMDPAVRWRRLHHMAAVIGAGALIAGASLVAGASLGGGHPLLLVVGASCSAAALGLTIALARRALDRAPARRSWMPANSGPTVSGPPGDRRSSGKGF
jgi:hypothetical protein